MCYNVDSLSDRNPVRVCLSKEKQKEVPAPWTSFSKLFLQLLFPVYTHCLYTDSQNKSLLFPSDLNACVQRAKQLWEKLEFSPERVYYEEAGADPASASVISVEMMAPSEQTRPASPPADASCAHVCAHTCVGGRPAWIPGILRMIHVQWAAVGPSDALGFGLEELRSLMASGRQRLSSLLISVLLIWQNICMSFSGSQSSILTTKSSVIWWRKSLKASSPSWWGDAELIWPLHPSVTFSVETVVDLPNSKVTFLKMFYFHLYIFNKK